MKKFVITSTVLAAALAVAHAPAAFADEILPSITPACVQEPEACDTFDVAAGSNATLEGFLVFDTLQNIIEANDLPATVTPEWRLPEGKFVMKL